MKKIPTPAQVRDAPRQFAASFLRILNKQKILVPLRWNRAQAHFHAHRTGHDLILKARQLGFTTYVQGEMYRRTVTSTRNTLTLTHDNDATTKIRLMADRFWGNCRFGDTQPTRHFANASLTTYPEYDSAAAIATAGSLNTGRGDTYSDIHGSEVAFWPDAQSIMTGAMQGGNPDVILESTPNGAQGYFYDLCMEALHGGGIWKLHFYPWWWDSEYQIPLDAGEKIGYTEEEKDLVAEHSLAPAQIKWRRYKIRELGRFFQQEYPEDVISCFLTSGQGYFGDLTGVFTAPANAIYVPDHRYGGGLDFAQTVDFTALPVFDFSVREQVDLLHINNLEWAEQRIRIRSTCRKWHIDTLLAEENSIGAPNIEALRAMGVHVQPFKTTNESKSSICSSLNEAIHFGGWKLLNIPAQVNEFNTFVATQLPSGAWQLAAEGEGHDDIVMGDALALRSGKYTVSDEDLARYGRDDVQDEQVEVIDDDMIQYHADTYGMTFEQAKADMLKERERR